MDRTDRGGRDRRAVETAGGRRSPMRRGARYAVAALPALVLLGAAFAVDAWRLEVDRLALLETKARHAAEALDLRLGKLLDLTEFCASSPALVDRVDLDDVAENCGRYAELIGAWVVIVELGDTHRQILNTRPDAREPLPAYPREEEKPSLLAMETRGRAGGAAEIAEVFEGRVAGTGVVTAGRHLRLADGRPCMLYVGAEVGEVSRLLDLLTASDDAFLAVFDPTRRLVARSGGETRRAFEEAPAWMVEALELGRSGARLDRPWPNATGGSADVGFHPSSAAPGWTAVAVLPHRASFRPLGFGALPLGAALLGLALSGLSFREIGRRDRAAARVAEAERARAEAERNSREKSLLLASLAHDIRSPVVSLLGSLELAEARRPSGSPETRAARGSAEALLQLVDDILELSYLGSGRFTLTPSPVDLRRLAEDAVERLRVDADRKGLDLRLETPGGPLPVVEVDRVRLGQVLSNLLSNGIKYTEAGTVALRLAAGPPRGDRVEVTFTVSDTGVGMAPEDVPKIFREFGRLESAVASGETGKGLGLAICRRILKGMGSELAVTSAPGEGSAFSFSLRLQVARGGAAVIETRPLEGTTILYAEDEPVIRDVTVRRLAAAGATVVEAADGAEALERLKTVSPDLVLLDLQMPRLDGVGTIRRLRAMQPRASRPIFVLTSHVSGPMAAEARAAGADEVFTKPVQTLPLAAALRARRGDRGSRTPAIGAAPDASDEPVLDPAEFRAVAETMGEETREALIARFARSLGADLDRMAEEVAAGRVAEAGLIAHRSRGLSQVFGARRLAARLLALEAGPAAPEPGGGPIAELRAMLDATLAAMASVPPGAPGEDATARPASDAGSGRGGDAAGD